MFIGGHKPDVPMKSYWGGGKRRAGIRRSVHNGVTISVFYFGGEGKIAMRIFGYCGFLIVWLLAPAPIAIADTAPVVAPDTTQSPSQLTPDELDLLNLLD